MSTYLPPPRVLWHAIGAFVTALTGALGTLYQQLAGSHTPISTGAWIWAISTALGAAFVAGKAAWVEPMQIRGPRGQFVSKRPKDVP
jgi:hypothetical protein